MKREGIDVDTNSECLNLVSLLLCLSINTVQAATQQAGNDLSRENIMNAATHLPDTTTLPLVLPGIKISTSPTDYQAMKGMRLVQFDGKMYTSLPD